ncbi:MAG: GGDEF domain-containing protein [Lachnospiraceae bacterium]|nr:GGDEF domain-containing protein [Lachnospiraceae bacterium]
MLMNSELYRKLKEFITKDTVADNESTKITIVIRLLLMSVFLYFIANLIVNWNTLDGRAISLSIVFAAAFIIGFGMSYRMRNVSLVITFSLGMLVFIWMNLIWYGWGIGVQHFLMVLLLLAFFTGYKRFGLKWVLAAGLCAIRIIMYFRFHAAKSQYTIPASTEEILQVINTVSIFWCLSVISFVFGKSSRETEGKLVDYNNKLRQEALTDNLTGLANRRRAMDYVDQILSEGTVECFSLCMCDIDFFKKVNDTWGHDCGDAVLRQIATIFKQNMPRPGLACRWGGEEFLLLFPGFNGDEANEQLMNIRDTIKKMVVEYEGNEVQVTMTFGLTEYDFSGNFDENVQEADERLYYGKNHGRDQIVF